MITKKNKINKTTKQTLFLCDFIWIYIKEQMNFLCTKAIFEILITKRNLPVTNHNKSLPKMRFLRTIDSDAHDTFAIFTIIKESY